MEPRLFSLKRRRGSAGCKTKQILPLSCSRGWYIPSIYSLKYLLPTANTRAMSKPLNTDDAGNVLRELLPALNESHGLGLALKLSPEGVQAIHYPNRPPQECLREVIIKFLQQAPESRRNWSTITDALASPLVNHQALAERLKAAHCPKRTTSPSSGPVSGIYGL